MLPVQRGVNRGQTSLTEPVTGYGPGSLSSGDGKRFKLSQCERAGFELTAVAQMEKNLSAMQQSPVRSLGREDPWRREWQPTAGFLPGGSHGPEPGGLRSTGSQRVRHDSATNTFTATYGASVVALVVKNPSAKEPHPLRQGTQESWVQSLGREDPWDEGTATHSRLLAGEPQGAT